MIGNLLQASNGSVGGGTPAPVDLTQGLVAHHLLNNNSDDIATTSGAYAVNGVIFKGDCAYFDGVDDYIETTFNPKSSGFTVSMWFRREVGGTLDTLLGRNVDGSSLNIWDVYLTSGNTLQVQVEYVNSSYLYSTQTPITTGKLYHLVLSLDGSSLKIYLDGVLVSTDVDSRWLTGSFLTNRTWRLGRYYTSGRYYQGTISNVRIYNEAKDQTFIDELYAEGYYPKPLPLPTTDGLIAHYPLTGTAEDAHGAGGNESGTEYNGVAFDDESVFKGDKVAVLDGVDDYVGCGDVRGSTSEITVSIFANADTTNSYDFAMRKEVSTDQVSYSIGYTSLGKWYVGITTDNNINFELVSNKSVVLGEWANISFTYKNGEGIKLYIDGVLDNSSTTPTGLLHYDTLAMNIGKRGGAFASNYFDGKLSNARVYNVALLQGDISDIYAGGYDSTVVPTTTGLVAHYKLNGDATDETGTYNGTVNGGMIYSGEQRGDSVASFDGVDDYVSRGRLPLNQNYTISIWWKKNSNKDQWIANQRSATSGSAREWDLNFYNTTSGLVFQANGVTPKTVVSTMIPYSGNLGEWHHTVITLSDTDLTMYTDGVLDVSVDVTGLTFYTSSTAFLLGKAGASTFYFDGELSDARFYDRALTAGEVTTLYNEVNEPTDGLVAYYPLTKEARANDMWVAYDGTENVVTYVDDAEFGSVSYYNGANAGIYFAGDTRFQGVSTFSGCFWIKTTRTVASDLISQWSSTPSNTVFEVQLNADGTIRILVRDSDGSTLYSNATNTTVVNDGNWHFVYFHFNGGECSLSIDLVNTSNGTNVGAITRTTTLNLWFGRRADGTNDFVGNFKDIHFFNRTLTTQELTDIYNYEKNFRPIDIDDGLVAYYPLANNSLDNYLNQYDATASAGVTFDGNKSTIPIGESITYPSMPTTYETLTYIHDNLFHNVAFDTYIHSNYRTWLTALLDNFNNCTLEEVRAFDIVLSDERFDILSKVKDGVVVPEIITADTTWVSPVTKTITVIVIGGGGGGASRDTGTSSTAYYDAGGEHGVISEYNIAVVKGQSYPIVIGAGGVGGYSAFNTGYTGGGTGGTSSFDTTYTSAGGGCPYLNLLTSATKNLYIESPRGHIEHAGFIGVSGASKAVAQNANIVGEAGVMPGVGGGSLNNMYHTSGSARGGAGANGAVIILI